jgi:hypothetical protein
LPPDEGPADAGADAAPADEPTSRPADEPTIYTI